MSLPLLTLNIGQPRNFREDGAKSAIAKMPVTAPIMLRETGFVGDEVADRVHHGGPDKALHHYSHAHYPWWQGQLPGHALWQKPGAFGENIATTGLLESEVRIGDRFQIGEAIIEVSHGRQPCWKLDHRFGVSGANSIMKAMITSRRCGIYFRVVQTGMVAPDDSIIALEQADTEWTIERVFTLLVAGGHKGDIAAVRALAAHPKLAVAWRERAQKLCDD